MMLDNYTCTDILNNYVTTYTGEVSTVYFPVTRFEKVSLNQFKKDVKKNLVLSTGEPMYSDDKIEEIYNNIKLPRRATRGSAGYDFYMPFPEIVISKDPKDSIVIPTGIKVQIPYGLALFLYPRSSYGYTYGMGIANTIGVIDADFYNNPTNEGHISVKPTTTSTFVIKQGDRYIQGIFTGYGTTIDDEPVSETRTGGTGSTGV